MPYRILLKRWRKYRYRVMRKGDWYSIRRSSPGFVSVWIMNFAMSTTTVQSAVWIHTVFACGMLFFFHAVAR